MLWYQAEVRRCPTMHRALLSPGVAGSTVGWRHRGLFPVPRRLPACCWVTVPTGLLGALHAVTHACVTVLSSSWLAWACGNHPVTHSLLPFGKWLSGAEIPLEASCCGLAAGVKGQLGRMRRSPTRLLFKRNVFQSDGEPGDLAWLQQAPQQGHAWHTAWSPCLLTAVCASR